MFLRIALICIFLFAGDAQAQMERQRSDSRFGNDGAATRMQFRPAGYATLDQTPEEKPSTGRVVGGTLLSSVLLSSLGIAVGRGIDSDTNDSWIGVNNAMIVGGLIGLTVGAPLGAFLANREKGNFLLAVGGTGLAMVAALSLAETKPGVALIGLPIAQITISIAIIRATDE